MIGNAQSNPPPPSKGAWKSAIFIIFVEMAERFAYTGVAGNLITYLTTVLGEPTAAAAKNVNTWIGVSSVFPILGAFVADSYLGRFTTVLVSSLIYLAGLIVLTISAASLVPQRLQKAIFYLALYIMAVGEGGHKPCVQTFAADQFDEDTLEQRNAKSSFFNWWYLGIVIAACAAVLVLIYVEDYVSWTFGFGLPTFAVAVAIIVFLVGVKTYHHQRPAGSPFTRVAQVFVAAARKRHVHRTNDPDGEQCLLLKDEGKLVGTPVLARTDQFRCLDKAMIPDSSDDQLGENRDQWRLCTQNQVEEVKQVLRLIPIWLCSFIFFIGTAQLSTFFTKQGGTMNLSIGLHFKVAPASLQIFCGITIFIFVLAYDRILVPFARTVTGHPSGITLLQRMGVGMFLMTLTMAVCALVEAKRVEVARVHGLLDMPKVTVPMRVWWLIPQYMLLGFAEAATVVGMQELFYDQVPEEMRSMGAAAYLSTIGIGNFLSSILISIVQTVTARNGSGDEWLINNLNRAHLDCFYWLVAGLNLLNLVVYVWVAKGFVYKTIVLDESSKKIEVGEKKNPHV